MNQKLESDGYAEEDSRKWWKQEGDLHFPFSIFFSSASDNPFTVKSLMIPVPSYISGSPSEDMFLYLTFILVKEQGEWKIQFYGMEG